MARLWQLKFLALAALIAPNLKSKQRRQLEKELAVLAIFVKVHEIDRIIEYGITRTSELVISEALKFASSIPSLDR